MRIFIAMKHSFTIIAISENWLTNINREIYHLKGYSHKNTIREQRTGGGVSLFINKMHARRCEYFFLYLQNVFVCIKRNFL